PRASFLAGFSDRLPITRLKGRSQPLESSCAMPTWGSRAAVFKLSGAPEKTATTCSKERIAPPERFPARDRVEGTRWREQEDENRADRTLDRKRSTPPLRRHRENRRLSDRGAGPAGSRGHPVRERRLADVRRAGAVQRAGAQAGSHGAGSPALLHGHARSGAPARR